MKWLETHKHLVMVIICAVLVLALVHKVVAHMDGKAHDAFVLAEDKLKHDTDAQKAADAQAQKDAQAYSILKQQMDSQNAQLRSQITALSVALASRQAQDRALPPNELADRHIELIGGVPGDVKALPDGLIMTFPAARQTVVMLEEVHANEQVIKNQEGIITNDKQEIASIQTALTSSQAAETACKVTLKSQEDTCKAQVKELNAKGRKSKLKWFFGGIATGIGLLARFVL